MRRSGITGTAAIVTGAAQGIGKAVTRALVEHGARVAALDRSPTVLDAVADEPGVTGYVADVTDADRIAEVVSGAEDELGPIGLLVNVAGVLHTGPVVDCSDDDWNHTFAVNTTGVFTLSRAVARRMIPRRAGTIITVSSNAAGVPRKGMAAYAASKAASTMFTKSLGLELAEYGIRCNVVAPGSTDTPMQRSMWSEQGAAAVVRGNLDDFKIGIPLGALAEPDDVAAAVLFLASDEARRITMHELYVDGGATLRA